MKERSDYAAMGRTVGNLGNTYYLLGNYKKAIKYHEEVRKQPKNGVHNGHWEFGWGKVGTNLLVITFHSWPGVNGRANFLLQTRPLSWRHVTGSACY